MTVRLTVKQRSEEGGAEKPSVVLLDDEVITLGRDSVCQVVLNQQAVSRTHARISKDRSLFFVEDLGSSYGTTINGKKLVKGEKQLLRNGDVIVIAQFDVTFDRVTEGQGEGNGGSTQFVAKQVVRDVMRGLGTGGEQPYLRVMNGPLEGERLELADAQEYIIGRDDDVALTLKDDLVSRRHAKIRRDLSGTHVEDLASRNGIKVNRKRTKKKTLKDRDELEVGSVRLLFIDPTEVREAPVVLPDDSEDEATSATGPEDEEAPPQVAASSNEPPTRTGDEQGAPPPEAAASDAGEAEEQSVPEPGDATDEEGSSADEGSAVEESLAEDDGAPRPFIDLSNRTTLIFLGVAGLMVLVGAIILVALFAGA